MHVSLLSDGWMYISILPRTREGYQRMNERKELKKEKNMSEEAEQNTLAPETEIVTC